MKAWSRSSAFLLFLVCMIGLCRIWFLPLPAAAQEGLDVSHQVAVTFSGLRVNRATNTFDTVASLTNTSTTPMATPISLVLTTIEPSTVTVANASGQTSSGKPFLNVPVADGVLDPGETVGNMVIKFRNPNRVSFTFEHSVFSTAVKPVAAVRAALHALIAVPVTLDGSDSYAPGGGLLTFQWSLLKSPAGSTAILTTPERPNPRLVPDLPGEYMVELIVADSQAESLPVQMLLTAFTGNVPPNARAGRKQHARLGTPVHLDGSGSDDANGTPLDFLWSFVSVPPGSTLTSTDISTPDSATPTFVPDVTGTYVLNLQVNDGVHMDDDTVQVIASLPNVTPNAHAGLDVVVQVGEEVVLDGSRSVDPDAGPSPLSFAWTFVARPVGSTLTTAALQGATTATPRFTPDAPGAYLLRLQVNDGAQSHAVNVVAVVNQSPQAVSDAATTPQGTPVTIDVLANDTDPDEDPLTVDSVTQGGHGAVGRNTDDTVTYTPTAAFAGTDQFSYTISDNQGGSATAPVTITVTAPPPPPINAGQITLSGLTNGLVTVTGAPGAGVAGTTVTLTNSRTGQQITGTVQANGGFTLQIVAQGDDTLSLIVTNATGQSSPATTVTVGSGLPPDPSTVAPPLDNSAATSLAAATAFLYTGSNPIQTGVAPGTIELKRAAVLRGRVIDRSGASLVGVTITVLAHPEFGQTLSRADGMFDLAVNGGGVLTLSYAKPGYLPAQRQAQAPWQDYALLPDVALIPVDAQVTPITLSPGAPQQVARGSVVTDADGTRQATLLFPAGTLAEQVMPDGSTQPLSTLSVRATEYTVGPNGPQAMPAPLPPSSGYTYAVELSADEALAAGAMAVRFSQPVIQYVENFLGFPVGGIVPVGSYDASKAAWIPSANGRVIKILSLSGGLAQLDTTGAGSADNGATLGITDAERQHLATLYPAGQSLWRVPIPHFSPWDCNWPYGPPADAKAPTVPSPNANQPSDCKDCPSRTSGSIIGNETQTLGEAVPITGTPFRLHYQSDRTPGNQEVYPLQIPLSGASVPASLTRIDLEVVVAGQRVKQSFAAAPNQTTTFTWNGQDGYGRPLQGQQPVSVRVGYVYAAVYQQPAQFAQSFALVSGVPITGTPARQEITLWQTSQSTLGPWDARAHGLGGWSVSVHHDYDFAGKVLYLGNGAQRSAAGAAGSSIITTVAGTGVGGFSGDGGPATQARLSPFGVAVGPDGSLYIADTTNARIRRVGPEGLIATVAGTGVGGFSGDGGPATQARLNLLFGGMAVGPDGSLYIADGDNRRIRRVGPEGLITTVAGTGVGGFSGDGGPATQARLLRPKRVAVGPDGSLYIADDNRIRRVGPEGLITTVAGTGVGGFSGDGGPATQARLSPFGVAAGPDGSLYIADTTNARIRRVGPEGLITTVAGTGVVGFSGDGGPATQASLNFPEGMAVGPDGSLYIADIRNGRIRRVGSALPGVSVGDTVIPAQDGSEVYVFDATGRHLRTLHALTGAIRYAFTYDTAGHLTAVTDGDGNVTTIERDGTGNPTAIIAPFGQRTTLSLDANGYLASITNPAGESTQMTSTATGLLTRFTTPNGHASQMTYDALGRLQQDADAAGGSQTLARTEFPTGYEVTRATALDRTTGYQAERLTTGAQRRITTAPDGTQTQVQIGTNGSRVTTLPDGTVSNLLEGPDPRFAMQAPLPQSLTTTTGGLTKTITTDRTVSLADPANPLSPTALTETVRVNGRTYTSSYAAATQTVTTTTPAGRQRFATIDTLGHLVQDHVAGLLPIDYTYDTHGRLETVTQGSGPDQRTALVTYTSAGFPETLVDPLGRAVSFAYDAAGRITTQTLPDDRLIQYSYDANGNLTALTPPGRPAHVFAYTPVDLQETYTPPSVSGGGTTQTLYTYNADRQLTHITRPDGQLVSLDYDPAGRLSVVTLPSGQRVYSYDATTGQLTGLTASDGGTLTYSYTGALLTQMTWTGAVAGTVQWSYDNDFRVTTMSVNDSNPIAFQYDADSLLTQAGTLTLSRDAQNGLLTETALGTLTETLGYTAFGELASSAAAAGGTPLYTVQYTRDPLGRIAQKTETIGGVTDTFTYDYDVAGRLTGVGKNGVVLATYTYDANGNRVTGPGLSTPPTYDAQDRLIQYGPTTYSYTANGELRSKSTGGQTTTYTYDVLGNLTHVDLPTGDRLEYVIDGLNRRVATKVNGAVVRQYIYQSPLQMAAELDATGQLVSRFVYGSRAHVPDYLEKGGTTYRLITDHLGSVRLVVEAQTGTIVQRLDYDKFGRVLQDTNPGFQPFGFAGGLYEPTTQLVRFGARDYDPETGRWTSKDPIRFAGGDTNLYGYVLQDPINWVDPSGFKFGRISPDLKNSFGTIKNSGPAGRSLINDIRNLSNTINLDFDPNLPIGESYFNSTTGTITIGGAGEACVANSDHSPFPISRTRALTHELGHARHGGGTEFEAIGDENAINEPIDGCHRSSLSPINCR